MVKEKYPKEQINKLGEIAQKVYGQKSSEFVDSILCGEEILARKQVIKKLHEYNPDYVFLTESTSVPAGYIMKEAWKKAYPGEPVPTFYRFVPRDVNDAILTGSSIANSPKKKELEEFIKRRVKKPNAKILVYDTKWDRGISPGVLVGLFKNPEEFGFSKDIQNENVKLNLNQEGNNKFNWDYKGLAKIFARGKVNEADIVDIPGMTEHFAVTPKGESHYHHIKGKTYNFRGSILKKSAFDKFKKEYMARGGPHSHPQGESCNERRSFGIKAIKSISSPLEAVREYKREGQFLGTLMHEESEQEKQKALEQRVTFTTSVLTFVGSLFFIGSNITGNTISNFSNSTNSFIGVGLLIISLIAGTFWIKRK